MTPEQEIEAGRVAKELSEHPAFASVVAEIKADCFSNMQRFLPGSKEAVHCHYLMLAVNEITERITAKIVNADYQSSLLQDMERMETAFPRQWIDPPVKETL